MKTAVKKAKPKNQKAVFSVSPSAWMVWEKCALSLQNEKSSFQLEQDEFAKKGTELHAAIAQILSSTEKCSDDSEDAAIIRFAVETARNEIDTRKAMAFIEKPLCASINGVNFSGIADVATVREDTIIVIDFKTGWRDVEAEDNSQLKLYAHIIAKTGISTLTETPAVKKWKGIIINARFNSVSYTGGDIDPNYLSNTAKDILDRTAKKQWKTGNHCAYCQRLSTCAKIRADIQKWLIPGAIDSITREPERLAEALRLAKPAEKLFETIKKEAQLFIDLGGEIPGVKIEYTAGTRTWPRDMTMQNVADRIGIPMMDMTEVSFISPAQAEKKGADKDAVNAIAIRPPRKGFKFV